MTGNALFSCDLGIRAIDYETYSKHQKSQHLLIYKEENEYIELFIMITTKESIEQVSATSHDVSDRNAAHLAGSIAENLHDGDYILSMIPNMVIFLRSDDWFPEIQIDKIDFEENYTITLSTGRIINFHGGQIQKAIVKVNHYRVVLLSNKGHSVFKINL